MSKTDLCPFCQYRSFKEQIIAEAAFGYAKWDSTPASEGHALIIPKDHEPLFAGLTLAKQIDLLVLLGDVRKIIDESHQPDAYTIGINDGGAAGRTIAHVHIHLIPRYVGDVPDPRGGIRRIFPDDPYIRQLG